MNWDADDPFGRPPRGPPIYDMPNEPREKDDEEFYEFFGPASFHPVFTGPADSDDYRVHKHERKFEMTVDQRACASPGSWPGLCTFSIDHSHTLIKHTRKHDWNTEERFKRPWGFVISQETRTEHNGCCREWWTIKVVLKRHEDPDFSYHTPVLWSAPVAATPAQETRRFAEWARSRGFETVRDFFY